ncbi:hypothetical protein ACFYE2_11440 [Kocuria sp. CPCC 205300]|uniref:hypothetical protein n=1 Tax=Kocuria sabuli TaxID=3071448 RepID=UPI0036D7FBB4
MSDPHPDRSGNPAGPPRYSADNGDQYGAARPTGDAPPEVGRLLTLTLASAGVYFLNQIAGLFTDQSQRYADLGLSADQIAQAESGATVTTIVTVVVALAIYALIYVFLKKGKNWARVLGIVLSILSIVGAGIGLLGTLAFGGVGIVLLVLGLLLIVVNVLWLVTAFKAPVKQWFSQLHLA